MPADAFQTLLIVVIALALVAGAVMLRVLATFHEEAVRRHNVAREVARLRSRHRGGTGGESGEAQDEIVV